MKKCMFLLGVAVAALASCTNEEVVSVPESAAINFTSFVNNTTKAVTEVDGDDLSTGNYYVFGNFGTNQSSSTPADWAGQVFNNELSTVTYYWSVGNYYRFGAYANGVGGKLDGATFNAATQTLTFSSYTLDDTKDLIAALGTGDASADAPESPVSLDFDHMLSQVGFTFYTTDGEEYTVAITGLKVTGAIQTGATGTYNGTATWTGGTDADYSYEDIDDIYHVAAITNEDPQQFKLVIPQAVPGTDASDKIQVSFTATITGDGINTADGANSKEFTIDLTSPDTEGWKPGFRYNYTAMVNGAIIAGLEPIEFTASVTDDWQDANDTNLTVQ